MRADRLGEKPDVHDGSREELEHQARSIDAGCVPDTVAATCTSGA